MTLLNPTHPLALGEHELPPWRAVNEAGRTPFILVCDHASPRVPAALGDLGLEPHFLGLHIAYDIGAEALTRSMAARLNAPAILSSYSRLVIDMNRGITFPDSIPTVSDDHVIPGNTNLTDADRNVRAAQLFHPYHGAITRTLSNIRRNSSAHGPGPGLISMHSFTPHMGSAERPWEVSIIWRDDSRIARPLVEGLRAHGLTVGENEPYSAFYRGGYTTHAHAEFFRTPNVLIEVRQDMLTDEQGIEQWSSLLCDVIEPIVYGLQLYGHN
jgi:predicted N-formylglutamate amidohydrolase